MSEVNSPLISAEQLMQIRSESKLILVDARYSAAPYQTYLANHLDGAIFIDPNLDMADIKADFANGGRHPLPEASAFCHTLGKLGISPDSHLVVYDDLNGANAAARFWWMMRAIGHKKIQVLDGGYQAAVRAGFPLSSKQTQIPQTNPYPAKSWGLPIASMEEVEKVAQSEDHLVIDVRSAERYLGKHEPIDLIAGHIPGAKNLPLTENLNSQGQYKTPEEITAHYLPFLEKVPFENVIVHCGSGVSACHTLLALDHAGLGIPKLYVGSWSEWSRNNKPIGKGE